MTRAPRLRSLASLVAAAVLFTGLGACGDTVDPPAASVNGRAITQAALDAELSAITGNDRFLQFLESQGNQVQGEGQGTYSSAFVARVLTRQIFLELVHREFLRRRLVLTDADRETVQRDVEQSVGGPEIFAEFRASYRATLLRRSAEITKLQVAMAGRQLDDKALREYYDANLQAFVATCVQHILFTVLDAQRQVDTAGTEAASATLEQHANAAKARLDAGEPFDAVAKEVSQDPQSGPLGGELGCGGPGRFDPVFEATVDSLQPGQVSAPVKTQFGWHIILVRSREPAPFEEVTNEIRQRVLGEAQEGFGTFLREQVTAAEISVNPRFGRFDKEAQNPGVVPRTAPTTVPVGGPPDGGAGAEGSPIELEP